MLLIGVVSRLGRLVGLAVLAGAGVGLMLLYFRLDPARYPFPRCPLHWLTGLHCPGCGTQRALHALLHGQVGAAAHYNLLAVLYAPIVLFGVGEEVWRHNRAAGRTSFLYRPWFGWLTVAVVVAFVVLRNLPYPWAQYIAP